MAMGALGDIIDVILSPNLLHDYAILYRSVYFQGRYGSGKTALAVWLAVRLAEKYRYRIISNIEIKHPAVITSPSPGDFEHAVILLDEAADVLDAYEFKSELIRYFKYLRHRDLIILLPSVDEVHKRLRKLIVERVFNMEQIVGLPLWIYQWWRGPKTSPPRSGGIKGYFKWWVDSRVFGLYNSTHGGVGLTTERIISALIDSLSGTHAALGKGPLTPLVEVLDELDS
jgi:zona occludens toxin (predicted ATPase)